MSCADPRLLNDLFVITDWLTLRRAFQPVPTSRIHPHRGEARTPTRHLRNHKHRLAEASALLSPHTSPPNSEVTRFDSAAHGSGWPRVGNTGGAENISRRAQQSHLQSVRQLQPARTTLGSTRLRLL